MRRELLKLPEVSLGFDIDISIKRQGIEVSRGVYAAIAIRIVHVYSTEAYKRLIFVYGLFL